ncbi:humpty dumpty [Carabus blaptoides fortunei]
MSDSPKPEEKKSAATWIRPGDVMAIHRLKLKKKALQARMNRTSIPTSLSNNELNSSLSSNSSGGKRKNPFLKNDENKKPRLNTSSITSDELTESSDSTLFKLLHSSGNSSLKARSQDSTLTSFSSVFSKVQDNSASLPAIKTLGEKFIPIDWTLKTKLRLMSSKQFAWNRTLKTSEEASGITGFVRCLDTRTSTSLDTSPNAQFHQCCLYWQHPVLPWLQLFPRTQTKISASISGFATGSIRESLQSAWADSLRSLFQLVRARQCPYFYVCANTFTACFRAAGIGGYSEMHVLLTPTTRGFRHSLRQEDIAFTMPLKNKHRSTDGSVLDLGYDTLDSASQVSLEESACASDATLADDDDEPPDEQWLESMGVNAEDIKRINYTQAKITHRAECEVDNSEQSLLFVEGVEAHGLYNFLLNCKSIVASTGPLAGVPPTLLSPVSFHGASLQSLKVRENRIRDNNADYFSIELAGPILPHTLHNLYSLLPKDTSVTATFANIPSTAPFSKVKISQTAVKEGDDVDNIAGSVVFGQENLSDCGLNKEILKHFCSANPQHVQHYDSLKYSSETKLFIWM